METTVIYLRAGKKVPWNSNDPEVKKKMLQSPPLETKSSEEKNEKPKTAIYMYWLQTEVLLAREAFFVLQ